MADGGWLLAATHLLALAIGSGGIWARTVALRSDPMDEAAIRRALRADTFWGIAALLWLSTGLLRLLGGYDKGTQYYIGNDLFLIKMALFLLVVAMEVRPAITLVRWRLALRRGRPVDVTVAPKLARISMIQAHILVVMIYLAAAMARGVG